MLLLVLDFVSIPTLYKMYFFHRTIYYFAYMIYVIAGDKDILKSEVNRGADTMALSFRIQAVTLLLLLNVLVQHCSALVIRKAIVPHTAKPGFILLSFTSWGQKLKLDSNTPLVLQKHFEILTNGDLVTKSDISHLLGQNVALDILNEIDSETWKDRVHVEVKHSDSILVFPHPKYTGNIKENEPAFTPVDGLEDLYVENGGKKVPAAYDIIKGPTDLFEFHRNDDGSVTLIAKRPLDRELQEEYILYVQASVADPNIAPAKTVIRVTVEDENDNIPKFETKQYFTTIKESTPSHATILKLRAVDPDSGKISYRLVPCDMFQVDSLSGNVKVKESKKLKPGKYKMKAYAKDSGNFQSEPVDVIVKVLGDSVLKFKPELHSRKKRAIRPLREIEVSETSIGNLFPILQNTDNNFHFKFKKPAPELLEIDPSNGSVKVKPGKKLDYETQKVIRFTVVITRLDDLSG